MKTAIVTDGKYRSSIAAVRALHRAGYQVIVTQTRADVLALLRRFPVDRRRCGRRRLRGPARGAAGDV